jgi:glycosyltransferase involved in cell wall biosynthesis
VVVSGRDRSAQIVRDRLPSVTVVDLGDGALPGAARNAGLRVARGDYVSFPGSHVELPPGSLAARIRAHDLGYAMVTGTTVNGTPTRAGWASYFLDHSSVLPGRPSEELRGPPAHCSYIRKVLLEAGGFPGDRRSGEDTVVNVELSRRGYRAYRSQDIVLIHRSPCRGVIGLLRHHFQRGRGLGRILMEQASATCDGRVRRQTATLLRGYVSRRLFVTSANVQRWGEDLLPTYERAFPLVRAATIAAWVGAWAEAMHLGNATPKQSSSFRSWRRNSSPKGRRTV